MASISPDRGKSMPAFESIERPERWNVPFSSEMTDTDVDRLLAIEPFSSLDPKRFRGKVTLRGILQNDTRIVRYQKGDIIVRQGDWGNTAFFIVSGTVCVGFGDIPSEILGRPKVQRKGFWRVLAQLWSNHAEPEVRDVASYREDPRLASRGSGQETRIYLQDISSVLNEHRTAEMASGQFFGEYAALGRSPRQATVFADQQCTLLEIRWQGLRDLMRRDEGIRTHIDRVFRERALRSFLHNTPIFQHLDEDELSHLVQQTEFETYGQFDWAGSFKRLAKQGVDTQLQHEPLIAQEGEYPNGVMIIRSGLARLSKRHEHGHRTIGYLTPGHVYGLDEVVEGWRGSTPKPLAHSLRAIGIASVVVIPVRLIEELLLEKSGRHNKTKRSKSKSNTLANTLAKPSALDLTRVQPDFVEFLVQNR